MGKLISVIVPVYNVEKYLEKCLDSLNCQTYENLEVLLIDDGSTDNSLEICKNYSEKDNRFFVYTKSNGGASSARNYGLKLCKGDYIAFIDADDFISEKMFEILISKIKEFDVDISICNFNVVNNEVINKNVFSKDKIGVCNKEEFLKNIFGKNYYQGYLWNKLFCRKVIFNNDSYVKFDENTHISEDLIFLLQLSDNINRVYYDSSLFLYNYVKREGSIVNSFNKKNLLLFDTYEKIINYANLYNKDYVGYYKFLSLSLAIKARKFIKDNTNLTIIYGDVINKIIKKYFFASIRSKNNTIIEKLKLIIKYIANF